MNEVVIYKTLDNQIQIDVKFENETIWLDAHSIALLFKVNRPAIVKHIQNIFKSDELSEISTCSEMEQVAADGKNRKMKLYNLDVIISVGYRVNSKQATQFRQWATLRLKEYLVKGYTINQKRLEDLQKVVEVIEKRGSNQKLELSEVKGLLDILSQYTLSFVLLNQFDSNSLKKENLTENITYEIKYDEAMNAIIELKKQLIAKKEASDLFGKEKDDGFKSSLQSVVQTFGGVYVYPSIEEQAANLLYFVIKNHSFCDGNKRIGALLFIWFLEKNKHRFKKNGEVKINDNALVVLAILVAQSQPKEKQLIIQLIINLLKAR